MSRLAQLCVKSLRAFVVLTALTHLSSCTNGGFFGLGGQKGEESDGSQKKANSTNQNTAGQHPINTLPPNSSPTPVVVRTPSPSPTIIASPQPSTSPSQSSSTSPESAGDLTFNAIVFVNMEQQKHASDAGKTAILECNGRTVAVGAMTASAATDGMELPGEGGAYSASSLKISLSQISSDIPSQCQGKLSICNIQGVATLSVSSSQCQREQEESNARPTSWIQADAPFTASGRSVKISNRVYGNGDDVQGGLSLNHIVYAGAHGAQVATNDDGDSPLVLDLDRDDKLSLLPIQGGKKSVFFDVLNLGQKVSTGWVKGNDGLLALDVNGDGLINNGSELFGEASYSVKPVGKFELSPFLDGFSALAQYDENKDGVIDSKDSIFKKLLVWQDKNGNGISEKIELKSLDAIGIQAISLSSTKLGKAFAWPKLEGNEVRLEGSFVWKDGKKGKIFDVWFAQKREQMAKK